MTPPRLTLSKRILERKPVADPDLELGGGGGSIFLAPPGLFPSAISSFFTKIRGAGGPSGPLP